MGRVLVSTIGVKAQHLLVQPQEARVIGVTSSGIFLHLASAGIIFLTPERFHGPLTLNMVDPFNREITQGSPALIRPGIIDFREAALSLTFEKAAVWLPQSRPEVQPSSVLYLPRLKSLADRMLTVRQVGEINMVLPRLLDNRREEVKSLPVLGEACCLLSESLKKKQPAGVMHALNQITGMGQGLTPLGDDLACGLLLALSRWGEFLVPGFARQNVLQNFPPFAYQRTSFISANLIECAANGQADERLILALDGIVTGEPSVAACTELLLAWGNTSGIGALCGMALIVGASS